MYRYINERTHFCCECVYLISFWLYWCGFAWLFSLLHIYMYICECYLYNDGSAFTRHRQMGGCKKSTRGFSSGFLWYAMGTEMSLIPFFLIQKTVWSLVLLLFSFCMLNSSFCSPSCRCYLYSFFFCFICLSSNFSLTFVPTCKIVLWLLTVAVCCSRGRRKLTLSQVSIFCLIFSGKTLRINGNR